MNKQKQFRFFGFWILCMTKFAYWFVIKITPLNAHLKIHREKLRIQVIEKKNEKFEKILS